jgi:hypothetical protein
MKQAWVSAPEKREEIADEGYSGLGGGVQMPGSVTSRGDQASYRTKGSGRRRSPGSVD